MEFYFSDSNLPGDPFLLKTIQESEDGSILSEVVKFLSFCKVCEAACFHALLFVGYGGLWRNVVCCPGFERVLLRENYKFVVRW